MQEMQLVVVVVVVVAVEGGRDSADESATGGRVANGPTLQGLPRGTLRYVVCYMEHHRVQ